MTYIQDSGIAEYEGILHTFLRIFIIVVIVLLCCTDTCGNWIFTKNDGIVRRLAVHGSEAGLQGGGAKRRTTPLRAVRTEHPPCYSCNEQHAIAADDNGYGYAQV